MHIQMMMVMNRKTLKVKKVCNKTKTHFRNFKTCLFNNKTVYRSQERFKSYNRNVYTKEVNKIALSNNDDKRL